MPAAAITLTLVMLGVYAALAPLALWLGGVAGLAAAAIAALVCLVGAAAALVFPHLAGLPASSAAGVLVPMMLRMAVPLLLVVLLRVVRSDLVDLKLAVYLVVFYTTALAVETWITVARSQSMFRRP